MNNFIKADLYRIEGKSDFRSFIKCFKKSKSFRCLYYYRRCKEKHSFLVKAYYRILYHIAYKNNGVELPLKANIGEGVLFIHPTGITINSNTIAGKNLTLLKGCTIGATKNESGKSFVPIIGDNVYIGINSTVVGNIKIGNNVLIAANTFVNFDVPDNSVVLGSPGGIHHKISASKNYIRNPI